MSATYTVTVTKTKEAETLGEYRSTTLDSRRADVDFRLLGCSPYVIAWRDGRTEIVNPRQLKKLQAQHTWATDF